MWTVLLPRTQHDRGSGSQSQSLLNREGVLHLPERRYRYQQ
jgi:hypothetical protein